MTRITMLKLLTGEEVIAGVIPDRLLSILPDGAMLSIALSNPMALRLAPASTGVQIGLVPFIFGATEKTSGLVKECRLYVGAIAAEATPSEEVLAAYNQKISGVPLIIPSTMTMPPRVPPTRP